MSSCINADAVNFSDDELVLWSQFWELWGLVRLLCSAWSRAWICDDRFDVDVDSFGVVLEKVVDFRSSTEKVSLVR